MTWNYRITKHDQSKPVYFAVHEVFYDEKGKIHNWTKDPIDISGDSKKEVLEQVEMIVKDVKLGVLLESELEKNIK